MDKLKLFARKYFYSVGTMSVFITVIFTVFDLASPSSTLNVLLMMMAAYIPITLFNLMLFENGPYELSLSTRQYIYIALVGINLGAMMIVFGVKKVDTVWQGALYILYMIIYFTIAFAVAVFILKVVQKKKIKKINEKLNEFDGE